MYITHNKVVQPDIAAEALVGQYLRMEMLEAVGGLGETGGCHLFSIPSPGWRQVLVLPRDFLGTMRKNIHPKVGQPVCILVERLYCLTA